MKVLKEAFITKTSVEELIEEGGKHPLAVKRLQEIKDKGLSYEFDLFIRDLHPEGIALSNLFDLLENDFDLIQDELGMETMTESIPKEPIATEDTVKLTANNGWNIIYDGYGFGFTDGYTVDRITVYDDGRWASDSQERLPAYIKREMNKLIDKYGVEFFDRRTTPLNKKLGFEESLKESKEKHPEQEKIESALMRISGTEKVEFDYRGNDGVYRTPKNHLIMLVFEDSDKLGKSFEYFTNRREWKRKVLSTLNRLGWKQEDPVEDNDSYLYLVMQKNAKNRYQENESLTEASAEDVGRQLERAKSAGDDTQAWDLALCIENDEDIYNRFITPAIKNLQRKAKRGIYDRTLAVQLFYYVVENSLKYGPRWFPYKLKDVTVPTRYLAADELVDFYEDEFMEKE